MTDTNQVPAEILRQLGGNKFIAMTGARQFTKDGNSLSFRIPVSNGVNLVRITLQPNDTYEMRFVNVRGMTYTPVDEYGDLYADDLQKIFTEATGLLTHL